MSLALSIEHVAKQYRIYEHPGDRLKETLSRGRLKRHREFWALSDISFEIERGTTTGLVGPNGSGKSTLLQIITGTLEPTHGVVRHEGRIAALLELGAGFNPEFTGLENVFLNSSIRGLSRRETEELLPEILSFAEIGDFIHQPVKTYSTGMYVRLAFATAFSAHPQILIIDEALSVGDAVFQHRCLNRIKEMQEQGATILFVSHDAAAVRALCSRVILLNAGRIVADGKPVEVLNQYQKLIMEREEIYEETARRSAVKDLTDGETAPAANCHHAPLSYHYRHGDGQAEILSAELLDASRRSVEVAETGAPVLVRVRVRFHRDLDEPVVGFLIRNRHGIHIYGTNTKEQQLSFGTVRQGEVLEVNFPFNLWLGIDNYSVSFAVHSRDGASHDWLDGVLFFRVVSLVLIEGVANLNATAFVRRAHEADGADAPQDMYAATNSGP